MNTTPMRLRHNADEDPPEAFLLQAHLVDVHAILHKQKKEKEDLNDEIAKIRPELLALRREVSRLREEMDTRARIIKELEAEMQQRMKECEGQIEQQKSECESLLRILQDKKEKQKLEFEKEKQEMTATIAALESEIKQLRKEAHDQKTLSREIRETGESLVLILQDQKEKQALEFEKEKQAMTATIATLPALEKELQQLRKDAHDHQNKNAQQKLEFETRLDQTEQERDASAKARDMLQQEKYELEHKLADQIKQVQLAQEARDIAVAFTGTLQEQSQTDKAELRSLTQRLIAAQLDAENAAAELHSTRRQQAQMHVSNHISLSQDKLSLADANSKMKIEIARLRARCDELSARTHELQTLSEMLETQQQQCVHIKYFKAVEQQRDQALQTAEFLRLQHHNLLVTRKIASVGNNGSDADGAGTLVNEALGIQSRTAMGTFKHTADAHIGNNSSSSSSNANARTPPPDSATALNPVLALSSEIGRLQNGSLLAPGVCVPGFSGLEELGRWTGGLMQPQQFGDPAQRLLHEGFSDTLAESLSLSLTHTPSDDTGMRSRAGDGAMKRLSGEESAALEHVRNAAAQGDRGRGEGEDWGGMSRSGRGYQERVWLENRRASRRGGTENA